MNKVVEDFCEYYQEISLESLSDLDRLYSESAVFEDPLHSIQGLDEITSYFKRTLTNVTSCQFHIDEILETDKQAFVTWVMTFSHPKLNRGREIRLTGNSHLKFNEIIYYQRDYYDLGCMIYEQIPVLSSIIGKIKTRMIS
ncbi:MAG: nuclear transport factor 2 family protein [Porticoccaceae bacterium]|nr:nuclear transport factor 2 family protein [Porticoccaceae bacterium]